jgi:uncharacterized protein
MIKHIKRCCLFIAVFLLIAASLFAQASYHAEIPDLPAKPALVNDLGDMLTADEELLLENKLLNYEKTSSNEIAIVTVASLGGIEIADFAVELSRKWDIGKSGKKNGVLILASKGDRKINISPAYGLQGVLPDVICSRIIREQIVPNFKEGRVYAGFDLAVDKIIGYTTGEFTADEKGGSGMPTLVILFLFMLFIFIFFFVLRKKAGNTYVSRRGYKNNDTWAGGGGLWGGMLGGSAGSSWGSDDDSGGGFGGFGGGGGGFDGGGASGSW